MYAKIFRQIYESSIAESPKVRFTFMDLLVLADSDGVVDMTHESIARITNRPLAEIKETIGVLEQPDPHSRTPDHNGARLQRLDEHREWGWVILNYDRFRQLGTEEQRKAKTRERVRKHREKGRNPEENDQCNAPVTPCNAHVTHPYAYAYASSSPKEGGMEETNEKGIDLPRGFPASVNDAIQQCALLPADVPFVTTMWNSAMTRGGCDGAGQPIRSFQHYVAKHWPKEIAKRSEEKSKLKGSRPLKPDADKVLREVDKLLEGL